MARFILTIEAQVEAPSAGAVEQQRQAMKNLLGNRMLKTMLDAAGVQLVGYRVSEKIKPSE
jgi:hypothetical protein